MLASVDVAVQRATAGAGRLLVLEGPAGLGKSERILTEIEARVVDRGGTAVRGDSLGAGSAPALWPWVSIARRLTGALQTNDHPGEPGTGTADVALALLEGRTPAGFPVTDTDGAASRMRVFRAVLAALADERVSRPLVVVMDDLQWADADTLTLLSLAVDELVGEGVLFAVAVRSDETDADAVLGVIERLRRNDVQRISLAPLGIGEVSTLIRPYPAPKRTHRWRRRSTPERPATRCSSGN